MQGASRTRPSRTGWAGLTSRASRFTFAESTTSLDGMLALHQPHRDIEQADCVDLKCESVRAQTCKREDRSQGQTWGEREPCPRGPRGPRWPPLLPRTGSAWASTQATGRSGRRPSGVDLLSRPPIKYRPISRSGMCTAETRPCTQGGWRPARPGRQPRPRGRCHPRPGSATHTRAPSAARQRHR